MISLDNGSKRKKNFQYSLSEQILRLEDTLTKIQSRILRRQRIVKSIEEKYQHQGIELPDNIKTQYDNTRAKIEELEKVYAKLLQRLGELKKLSSDNQQSIS